MSQSIGGTKNAQVGPTARQDQPSASEPGEFAGKAVTAGGVLKTIGRVMLAVVTLGISELVIRLAQRKPPEVVPSAGPGKAHQALGVADTAPKPEGGTAATLTSGPPAQNYGSVATTGRSGPGAGKELESPEAKEAARRKQQKDDLVKGLGAQKYQSYLGAAKVAIQNSIQAKQIDFSMFHTLSDAEQVALYAYTTHEHGKMNAALRGGDAMGPAQAALCAALDSALEKLPPYEGPVHRGAHISSPDDRARYGVGTVVAEPCYTSTSKSTARAFDGNTQWAMESRTGRDISFISWKPHEQEILFPRDARFQVLDSKQVGGETRIVMKEV